MTRMKKNEVAFAKYMREAFGVIINGNKSKGKRLIGCARMNHPILYRKFLGGVKNERKR